MRTCRLLLHLIKRPHARQGSHQRRGVLLERVADVVSVDDVAGVHVLGFAGDGAERREERFDLGSRRRRCGAWRRCRRDWPSAAVTHRHLADQPRLARVGLADEAGEAALEVAEGVGADAQLLAAGRLEFLRDQARQVIAQRAGAGELDVAVCSRARGDRDIASAQVLPSGWLMPSLAAIRQRPCFE